MVRRHRGDSVRQRFADELLQNFADPRLYTDAFLDKRIARATIAKLAGASPRKLFAGGMVKCHRRRSSYVVMRQSFLIQAMKNIVSSDSPLM